MSGGPGLGLLAAAHDREEPAELEEALPRRGYGRACQRRRAVFDPAARAAGGRPS